MESRPQRKILKSPVAKRKSRIIAKDQKVVLERVLGLTVSSNATLACDPNTGLLAYPAGCVVVLYNPKKNKQGHIFNVSKKTITSLAFSGDGKHLVTGESGHQPAVRVWDVEEKTQIAEFLGHKFGVSCVTFSPNLKYIVSIGTQHDMQVCVWNWRTGSKVASNKVSSKVTSVAFSADGSHFVTAGTRHVKFWYLDSSKSKVNETVPLNGRNGILGDHRNNFFCDVVTGVGPQEKSAFCVTQSGFLCQFNEKRQMDKWVELRSTCATCISASADYIFVGCANGIVRVFSATSLNYVVTLPRPHHLGVDVAAPPTTSSLMTGGIERKYPDTLALKYDIEHKKVTCIYNDHSMYVWDVHDLKKIGKSWSFLYHSSCVYGVEIYPMLEAGKPSILPPNSFITCSSDDTIRIWNLDPHMAETKSYKNNIYSHDILKVMYMDPSLTSLCDIDYNPTGATDKTDTNYDDKKGIRSVRVSPDGKHLASGDRQGNVRIHDLENLLEIKQIEAHESEVLALEYSNWKTGPKVLASSSRDRLIHVFDVEQQYGLLQTLSDHSSTISSVKFTETDGHLKMISCGADKSILFRNLQQEPVFQFTLATHQVEKMTLYDMAVEPSHNFAAIACQDRNVRIYNIKNGKKNREYKGSLGDDGTLLRMNLDPSGSYAATSCSDKNLCVMDFYSGELQATMFGHSEIATDVRFMNDLRHMISTSGDGCIFVWRVPPEMTSQMYNRMTDNRQGILPPSTNGLPLPKIDPLAEIKQDMPDFGGDGERAFFSPESVLKQMNSGLRPQGGPLGGDPSPVESLDYRFSISQLPSWAKKQLGEADVPSKPLTADDNTADADREGPVQATRRRWAPQREVQNLVLKHQDGKSVCLAEDQQRIPSDADTDLSQDDLRRDTMVINRPSTVPTNMPVIMDVEGDEEDDLLPLSSKTFVKTDLARDVTWDDLYNFDNDADSAETEVIYYPPSEGEGSDCATNTYQVFNAGPTNGPNQRIKRKSISSNSLQDGDSESTDPISMEDLEEDDDSNNSIPSTPVDDVVSKSKNREKFLKETFENLSFTPSEKFSKGLDNLEEELETNGVAGSHGNPRQSLSARFFSKSQAANARGPFTTRQDNWFDKEAKDCSVQRSRDDMARNLDQSRKMLMAMGWKKESPDTDNEDPFAHPSIIPTSPPHTPQSKSRSEEPKVTVSSTVQFSDSPSMSSSAVSNSKLSIVTTPTSSRKSLTAQPRPRTLPLDRPSGRTTPTDKTSGRSAAVGASLQKKDLPKVPSVGNKMDELKRKNTRYSAPIESKDDAEPVNRRASYGSSLNKSLSKSLHSLSFKEEEFEFTPKETSRKTRSKWAKTSNANFGSVPNLLELDDDDGKLSVNSSEDTSSIDTVRSESDINDNVVVKEPSFKEPKAIPKRSAQSASTRGVSKASSSSRTASSLTSRSNSVDDRKRLVKNISASTSNLSSAADNTKSNDRDLMPPPAAPSIRSRPDRAPKRGNDPRRRTTDNSGFSLEEAKEILSGKSMKIIEIKEKAKRRSESISPSRELQAASVPPRPAVEVLDFVQEADPILLKTSTEIELTAAELRRNALSASGNIRLPLEVSPNDPPERDRPRDKESCVVSNNKHVADKNETSITAIKANIESLTSKLKVLDGSNDSCDSRSSGDSEECASPSVKERIARLNKHVSHTDRQSSPFRGRLRSESPLQQRLRSESPVELTSVRKTSSLQVNFSNSPSSSATSSLPAIPPTSVSLASSISLSTAQSDQKNRHSSLAEIQESELSNGNDQTLSLALPGGILSEMALSLTGTPSKSGPMTTSLDSEGAVTSLSPGNQSSSSPRSVADTGLGSDTDLDTSQTFRPVQMSSHDKAFACLEMFRQMTHCADRFLALYAQVQQSDNEDAANCKRKIQELLPAHVTSLTEGVGLVLPSNSMITMMAMLRDMNSKINTLVEK
ncbi:mitogen-activated protein kinase-binding protein 1-like isoform X2 [Dreissena polymorpha]|uniref:mitogen-activated protein kinase-binding protein 1-like isoform X2 n=1 Tax=Dreissena polymorpha TaxID=45954 RepID=UPI002263F5E6|nr:mitogen-activated protein kinase-binding protein 1-like isoform X2 [Dreissena polymorpha]